MMGRKLWEPGQNQIRSTNLFRFMEFLNSRFETQISDYPELLMVGRKHFRILGSFLGVCADQSQQNVRYGHKWTIFDEIA